MLLARGSVIDRPWGQTLGALAAKRLSGQVIVISEGKDYAIAFDDGAIVAATSPLVSDAAVRVALTNHLISKAQVNDLSRRVAAAPERDDVDVILEAIRLTGEHAERLRRRVIAQRAARTFSLESGEFTVDDQVTLQAVPGIALDVRGVIYQGARMNVPAQVMYDALRMFGEAYMLRRDADESVARFEFTEDVEHTILAELRAGTSLPEIEAAHRDIDPRTAQAMIYALMAVGACEAQAAPAIPRAGTATISQTFGHRAPPKATDMTPRMTTRPSSPPSEMVTNMTPRMTTRTATPSSEYAVSRPQSTEPPPVVARTPTSPATIRGEFDDGSATPAALRASRGQPTAPPMASGTRAGTAPPASRTSTPQIAAGTQGGPPAPSRTSTPPPLRAPTSNPAASRAPTPTAPPAVGRAATGLAMARTTTMRKTKALIAARSILVEQGADHFALLGVPFDASPDIVRTTYLSLSSQLHPDKLAELGVDDQAGVASRLFAQIGQAFAVLTDTERRTEYMASLLRPDVALPPAPPPPRTKTSDQIHKEAAEAMKRGESALRRDEPIEACLAFAKAVELMPNEVDYGAMLGWAQFCAATDKAAAAPKTRPPLEKAIQKSEKPARARFLLGRMERMLGRDREAMYHFQQVIDLQPNHAEAASEIRAIEARQRGAKR